ncbi:MAG: hypothetical protein NW205_00635 [Hyphomicrobiaceae bacterium]|nr:hypothetical protein [Hyphomicrobiaceae bacterium]
MSDVASSLLRCRRAASLPALALALVIALPASLSAEERGERSPEAPSDGLQIAPGVALKGFDLPAFSATPATGDIKTTPAAAAPAPQGSPVPAPVAAAPASHVTAATPGQGIYDDRARKLLAREGGALKSEHPLAAAFPGHHVVVCEAGCAAEQTSIVYLERADARSPIDKPTSGLAALPAEAVLNALTCVGGCYDDAPNVHVTGDSRPVMNAAAGIWLSTTKPLGAAAPAVPPAPDAAPAPSPSRWHDRLNAGAAP